MVAGGLRYVKLGCVGKKNQLIKLGKINIKSINKNLFEVIADHPGSSITNVALISVGHSLSTAGEIRCYSVNAKGKVEVYYDKDTFDFFIKPVSEWDDIYIKKIDCSSTFSYDVVEFNAEQHLKVGA